MDEIDLPMAELLSGGLLDEIAAASRKYNVGITLSCFPHDDPEDDE